MRRKIEVGEGERERQNAKEKGRRERKREILHPRRKPVLVVWLVIYMYSFTTHLQILYQI